jgi:4-aminobutyrate aminotransferase-like enzyme
VTTTTASPLLPVYAQTPIEPVRGDGVWLETADGRRLLDFYGGHAVALLGYRHPRLLAALAAQAEALFFQSNSVPLAVRERAAAALVRFAPEGLGHVFFVNSGAEANENACAWRCATGRPGRGGRGRVSRPAPRRRRLTWGDNGGYGFPPGPSRRRVRAARRWRRSRAARLDGAAALIVEPVQGLAGAVDLGRDFLAAAREADREAPARAHLRRGCSAAWAHRLAVRGAALRRDAGSSPSPGPRRRLPPVPCWWATSRRRS